MYNEIINLHKEDLEKSIEHFKNEASKIRTGRANPSLVEDLLVDYYGAKTPLKQIASINTPEPRTISIQPWDRGALAAIEGAIRSSDLNLNPMNDGILVRINIPMLTEDRRREMVKALNQKAEEGRIAVRSIREEILKEIKDAQKAGEISEDDEFAGKEKLQIVVDEYNKKIEELRAKKEVEIMTV
ncbi:MAG: Ribosome-recycling factor [Candidatus Moranbacteria bacterium GW2011_GWE1_36_7]|nr:MAG: Ribosome-recycling factor [Candidatus Moranbacteria bacterium GW2011_GWD2_36_12]KKQ05404.1 MAG: Ribosome-recycling factor [Candidatus Moranbacteria bacterium GW2011_GWE2_36_40]KKQ12163.1 MAG: Ribosome-recycling factor [Candidatus Moranbacteria bacterium GW2011_GWE1_36_7]